MVLSKASPLSLLLGLIHPGSPLWKSHFFLPLQCREIQHAVLGGIYAALSIPQCLSQLESPFLGIALCWEFLYFHEHLTPGCHQKLINPEAIKTEELQFITSFALLHFPLFAFIPAIAGNQISINCQISRELGRVFPKWCQGCGNQFAEVLSEKLPCKRRSWCLKSSGKAQIRGVVSGLFSLNVTSQRICLHTLFTFGLLLFYSRTEQKLMSGSKKKTCQVGKNGVDFRGTFLCVKGKESEMLVMVFCHINPPRWPTGNYPPSSEEFSS